MSVPTRWSPPSSSLPRLQILSQSSYQQLRTAIGSLRTIYCPLRLPKHLLNTKPSPEILIDSGYVSEDERSAANEEDALSALRADAFERGYAVRWLTRLIAQAEELPFDENAVTMILEDAAFILSSVSDPCQDDEEESLTRNFSFPLHASITGVDAIHVRLNDAPLTGHDHTDVGLQSWGASIVFSSLLCADPDRFELRGLKPSANILELGAGTGLISLTMARLLSLATNVEPPITITATDYHAAVLDNLRANIALNDTLPSESAPLPVGTATLDWQTPPVALSGSVDMLFAADVVYAPEHAAWLRDCATQLLTSDGIFWLVATIRTNGKFEGISDTVEAAFAEGHVSMSNERRRLSILRTEHLEKREGIGRGDESGYLLFKIGWFRPEVT